MIESVRRPSRLTVLIDGGCPMCRRTAGWLRALDWLHRLTFEDARNDERRERWAPGVERQAAMSAMLVVPSDGGVVWSGYDGFAAIARVVPLFWPLVPFVRLPLVRPIGRRVYAAIAARRRRDECNDEVCGTHSSLGHERS